MKPLCILLGAALLATGAQTAAAGAKKQSAVAIRFYAESSNAAGGSFSQSVEQLGTKRKANMQSMELLSERDIKSYYPFQASDGSFGAYFKLDTHGSNLLSQHTMANRGTYLFVFFNGRHVIDLLVNKPVRDGIATIPRGLTAYDMSLLETTFPVIGREDTKPSKKKKQNAEPRKLPKAKASPSAAPKPSEMPRMQPAMVRQPDGTMAPAAFSVGAGPNVPPPAPAQ